MAAFDIDTSVEDDVTMATESGQTMTTTTTNTTTRTTATTTTTSSSAAAAAGTSSQEPQLRQIKLTSVLQLRDAIDKDMHSGQYYRCCCYEWQIKLKKGQLFCV